MSLAAVLYCFSLLWQATILTRSACTVCEPSSLKLTFLIMNVHTSSQNRYVSRWPCVPVRFSYKHSTIFAYLELKPCLDLLTQYRCDTLIEVLHNTHRQLGLDSARGDQVIESVCKSYSDAIASQYRPAHDCKQRTMFHGRVRNMLVLVSP